ncbi:energy-coupling factor transporter transmembrane protein EcfT [Neobacillus notoginsengisoli]|uniref:Energy-coupling factor transporter transmembrane protein EcfT n=1 Tax=Neobacillus notoginsengisoli TaxID=1578198 RepID=A0A417YTJ6_9BACI|nr:energy-coupling factor transporter transmembrane component T [Neobacillus notoginsengisoli]RHW40395.1 energy-coupling factor transporter transmembrane protein EcfT [Neobacillus notoginsengisoli]
MNFQYQPGNSFLHSVDPLNKVAWMVCISILAFIYEDTISHVILFAAVMLIAVVLAKLSVAFIFRGIWMLAVFSLGFFVLQVIFVPGKEILFSIGSLSIFKESVDFATAITFRIITVFLTSMVFVVTTDPRDLVLSLTQHLKIPYRIAYSLSIALRFIPTLESEAKVIEAAQVIRGVGKQKGLIHKIANFKRFTMPLLMSSIRRVHMTAITMEARGYGAYGTRTYTRELKVTAPSIVFSLASAAITVSLIAAKFI